MLIWNNLRACICLFAGKVTYTGCIIQLHGIGITVWELHGRESWDEVLVEKRSNVEGRVENDEKKRMIMMKSGKGSITKREKVTKIVLSYFRI